MTKRWLFAVCALAVLACVVTGIVEGIRHGVWDGPSEEQLRDLARPAPREAIDWNDSATWLALGRDGSEGAEGRFCAAMDAHPEEFRRWMRSAEAARETSTPQLEVRYYDQWGRRVQGSQLPQPVWTQDGWVRPLR